MHLGGNHRWVPLSFENNNNNKKDIAHINFTLRYLQLYLLFSCIAGAGFAFFLGGKFSSSFTSLDNILWSKTLLI